MKRTCFLLLVNVAAFSSISVLASPVCQPGKWRELENERKILREYPRFAKRTKGTLIVYLQNGKKLEFKDRAPAKGGAFDLHRVFAVAPKGEWVALFEPRFDSANYRVVHLKSGKSEDFNGCPVWSQDGEYFVSINEDLESGQTVNEAILWHCVEPDTSCKRIWDGKIAGSNAEWKGRTVTITGLDAEKGFIRFRCVPSGDEARCAQMPD